jgi:hypothetical protein
MSTERQKLLIGPMVQFQGVDDAHNYRISILVVSSLEEPLSFSVSEGNIENVEDLYQYKVYHFYRYDVCIPQKSEERPVTYTVGGYDYTIVVPGTETKLRWAFFSCNGFSNDVEMEKRDTVYGGDQPLWDDLLRRHEAEPFHFMVGGGDQLYCDDVFTDAPLVKAWNELPTMDEKHEAEATEELREQVYQYYFNNYLHFFNLGGFARAMRTIPFIFGIDDHDIFDGFGSYPEELRTCPVFQAIGEIGGLFYMLFQQHTTPDRATRHGYIGNVPRSFVRLLSPTMAIAVPDGRAERTIERIVSEETYQQLFSHIAALPSTVRHLIVLLGVPIVYPRLTFAESALQRIAQFQDLSFIAPFTEALRKTGLIGQYVNHFGQPELLDDLADHWTAENHLEERREFIVALQRFAIEQNFRVTFIAGDVHCCGAGYLHSREKIDPLYDPRHMAQIISSAIVNVPPPGMVIKALHYSAETYELDSNTVEDMYELFSKDVNGKELGDKKIIGRRNWCSVACDDQGGLDFTLNVECEDHNGTVGYTVNVPRLERN